MLRILGVIECSGKKHAPLQLGAAVLDLSIYGQTKGQKLMTVYRLAGIASGAVVTIALVDSDGVSINDVAVRSGVYTVRHLPPGVVAIAPMNASGVWLTTCGFGKGSLPILLMRC